MRVSEASRHLLDPERKAHALKVTKTRRKWPRELLTAVLVDAMFHHQIAHEGYMALDHVFAIIFLVHPLPLVSAHGKAEHWLLELSVGNGHDVW